MKPFILAVAVFLASHAATTVAADSPPNLATNGTGAAPVTPQAPVPPKPPPAQLAPSLAAAVEPAPKFDPAKAEAFADAFDLTPPTDLDLWIQGYLAAGGPEHLLNDFVRPGGIIDCESNYRFDVVSPTRDYGGAQINRAVHHDWVETLFGAGQFETAMTQPWPNGWAAAVLAIDSGTEPWFMSRRCHRL